MNNFQIFWSIIGFIGLCLLIFLIWLYTSLKDWKNIEKIIKYQIEKDFPDLNFCDYTIESRSIIELDIEKHIYPSKNFRFYSVEIKHLIKEGICEEMRIYYTLNLKKGIILKIDMEES